MRIRNVLLFACSLLAGAGLATGQVAPSLVTPANDTGVQPYGTYAGTHESVNLTNGNMHLEIPLVALKGRNGQNLTLTAQYDSKNFTLSGSYDPVCDAYTYTWSEEKRDPMIGAGWRLNLPYLYGGYPIYDESNFFVGWAPYILTAPDGSKHTFLSPRSGGNLSHLENDNASMQLVLIGTTEARVTTADGTIYFFPLTSSGSAASIANKIQDRDGNFISITAVNNFPSEIRDNMNRRVLLEWTGSYLNQNRTLTIKYDDADGIRRDITIPVDPPTYSPTFTQPVAHGRVCRDPEAVKVLNQASSGAGILRSVTLPNGDAYSFQYNNWAEISRVNYPTGGHTTYTYDKLIYNQQVSTDLFINADFREVMSKTEYVSETEVSSTTQYSYSGTNNNGIADVYESATGANPIHTRYTFTQAGFNGNLSTPAQETSRTIYKGSPETIMRKTETLAFTATKPYLPATVRTTLDDGSQFSETFQYDSYSATICSDLPPWNCTSQTRLLPNATQHKVYDFQDNLVRQTNTTWLNTYYQGAYGNYHIMNLKSHEDVGTGSSTLASTDWVYDTYSGYSGPILPSGVLAGRDSNFGTSFAARGKVTSIIRHSLANCGADSTEYFKYDDAGNLRVYTDPLLHQTTVNYNSADTQNCNPDNASSPTVAINGSLITSIVRANGLTNQYIYNACTGALATATDPNNLTTSYQYDSLGRLTQTTLPDSATVSNEYHENSAPPYLLTNNIGKVSKAILDGLGRTKQTIICEDGPNCTLTITAEIGYDFRSRKISETNPHRSAASGTDGTTQYEYDELNRVKKITKQDGSFVQTQFVGAVTTVTDEAGRTRESTADVLGRMVKVREDIPTGPTLTYITNYGYDVLGNLTAVTQNGDNPNNARSRWFTYNGKSELCTASNPETGNNGSGTISYQYNADGLVTLKTFNSGNTISYSYDVLHRLTGKHFTAIDQNRATPDVSYSYDSTAGGSKGLGYRTGMSDGSGNTEWQYLDLRARITTEVRSINTGLATLTRQTDYSYNQDGSLQWIKYPHDVADQSPQTVTYSYNAIGQPLTALLPQLDPDNNITVSSAVYGATGALIKVTFATGIKGAFSYTSRLQPRHLLYTTGTIPSDNTLDQQSCTSPVGNIMHLMYYFGSSGSNKGNLQTITNCKDTTRNESFQYDYLNRVTSAATPSGSGNYWSQSFSYDAWGNLRTVSPINAPGFAVTSVTTANQFTATDQYAYDADGNMTRNGSTYYVYDVENRLKSIVGGASYTYDGDGKRVVKSSGAVHWTGIGSEALTETDRSSSGTILAEYVFFGGSRIARIDTPLGQSPSVHYYFADFIKTTNVVTNAAGTIQQESMFYPFGGERVITGGDSNHYKFYRQRT